MVLAYNVLPSTVQAKLAIAEFNSISKGTLERSL